MTFLNTVMLLASCGWLSLVDADDTGTETRVDSGSLDTEGETNTGSAPGDDTGLGESDLWHLPMSGTLTIYSEGRWAGDTESSVFCDSVYTFTGHAYVGDCVDCNFEWAIDTIDHTVTGPECTSADYASIGRAMSSGRTLVQSDRMLNFSEEAGYSYGYSDAIGVRSGVESYRMFPSRPYLMTGVARGDGEMSWSRSSDYWDHHAGESSVCVGAHHYSDPHEWPTEFQRDFEFDLTYTSAEAMP